MDCNAVAEEELKRLRDIQRLLQAIAKIVIPDLSVLGLEEIL